MGYLTQKGGKTLAYQQEGGGRPLTRTKPVHRITLEVSLDDWQYITKANSNRTQWINQAIQAKREREEEIFLDLGSEVREEIERQAKKQGVSVEEYQRLALIHAAVHRLDIKSLMKGGNR
jgi:hypothetical protein